MDLFIPGKIYRRRDLHDQYGGQRQGGISTPTGHPFVMLFSSPRGKEYGYDDGWHDDDLYYYTGEGQRGDMTFTRGNRALRDHQYDGKDLHLFKQTTKGYVRYIDQMIYTGHHLHIGPDITTKPRQRIIFELAPIRQFTAELPIPTDSSPLWQQSLTQLRKLALAKVNPSLTPKQRLTHTHKRATAIKIYTLQRANNKCEYKASDQLFKTTTGRHYLEVHHIQRLTDGGPDHPLNVIALCPYCHRRAHYAHDHKTFNNQLDQIIAQKEP